MWARVISLLCILCFKFSYAVWSYCLIESSESWENRNAALLNKTSFIPNEGQEFIYSSPSFDHRTQHSWFRFMDLDEPIRVTLDSLWSTSFKSFLPSAWLKSYHPAFKKKKTVRNWVRFCGQGNHTSGTRWAFLFFHLQLRALAWLRDLTQDEHGCWLLWYFWPFLNYGIVVLENHIGVLFSLKL